MTRPYSIESITSQLHNAGLPLAKHFARALVALLTAKKISLYHVAALMAGKTNAEANRMQLRRCLDHRDLQADVWAKVIGSLLPKGPWILALDRTQWERGQTCLNLLVLSVVIYGSAVPLLWTIMADEGASDTEERIALMKQFLSIFGASHWRFLTADREFIGDRWIGWLMDEGLDFRIRVKAGEWFMSPDGRDLQGKQWFSQASCQCKPWRMQLWNQKVYVGGKPLSGGDTLVVIGNSCSDLLSDYRLRWKIEVLFQGLKGRGFDLESCRLSQEKRLWGWFGVLALGFCWCLLQGAQLEQVSPVKIKKHGRPQMSCFRRGLECLASLVACLAGRPNRADFESALGLLSPVQGPIKEQATIPAL